MVGPADYELVPAGCLGVGLLAAAYYCKPGMGQELTRFAKGEVYGYTGWMAGAWHVYDVS